MISGEPVESCARATIGSDRVHRVLLSLPGDGSVRRGLVAEPTAKTRCSISGSAWFCEASGDR